MNMNFNQIAMLQKMKAGLDKFRVHHPKFPAFLNAVSQDALREGTIVEITVTTPEGKNYCSNLKLNDDDLELIETLKNMRGMQPS